MKDLIDKYKDVLEILEKDIDRCAKYASHTLKDALAHDIAKAILVRDGNTKLSIKRSSESALCERYLDTTEEKCSGCPLDCGGMQKMWPVNEKEHPNPYELASEHDKYEELINKLMGAYFEIK